MRTGKSKGSLQSQAVLIRVQPAEKEAFKQCADLAGLSLSCWVRERLRTAATRELDSASRRVPFIAEIPIDLPVIDQKDTKAEVPEEVKPVAKSSMRRQVAPVPPSNASNGPSNQGDELPPVKEIVNICKDPGPTDVNPVVKSKTTKVVIEAVPNP